MRAITSRTARGFTLVELMVAVTISLLLLMGVVALFVSSRTSYETTERLSRIQENGRYALDQFSSDIRAAGFRGCARAASTSSRAQDFAISTLNGSTGLLWNFAVGAQGFEGQGGTTFVPATPALDPAMFDPDPSGTGDVLVLRIPRPDAVAAKVTTTQVDPADPLQVSNLSSASLKVNDIAMITDCEARAWFQVTGTDGGVVSHAQAGSNPGNGQASLLHPFKSGAEILPMTTVIYYLAPSTANRQRMSLWRKTGANELSDEIAEGVDRLEVQYGIDTTGDGRVDSYVTADDVANWDAVLSLQVALLARAPDAYGTDLDTQTYTLFSSPERITAGPFNDRFQRKVFTATVALRNQIID
jgi:type IV pilus assembly protein PilW